MSPFDDDQVRRLPGFHVSTQSSEGVPLGSVYIIFSDKLSGALNPV